MIIHTHDLARSGREDGLTDWQVHEYEYDRIKLRTKAGRWMSYAITIVAGWLALHLTGNAIVHVAGWSKFSGIVSAIAALAGYIFWCHGVGVFHGRAARLVKLVLRVIFKIVDIPTREILDGFESRLTTIAEEMQAVPTSRRGTLQWLLDSEEAEQLPEQTEQQQTEHHMGTAAALAEAGRSDCDEDIAFLEEYIPRNTVIQEQWSDDPELDTGITSQPKVAQGKKVKATPSPLRRFKDWLPKSPALLTPLLSSSSMWSPSGWDHIEPSVREYGAKMTLLISEADRILAVQGDADFDAASAFTLSGEIGNTLEAILLDSKLQDSRGRRRPVPEILKLEQRVASARRNLGSRLRSRAQSIMFLEPEREQAQQVVHLPNKNLKRGHNDADLETLQTALDDVLTVMLRKKNRELQVVFTSLEARYQALRAERFSIQDGPQSIDRQEKLDRLKGQASKLAIETLEIMQGINIHSKNSPLGSNRAWESAAPDNYWALFQSVSTLDKDLQRDRDADYFESHRPVYAVSSLGLHHLEIAVRSGLVPSDTSSENCMCGPRALVMSLQAIEALPIDVTFEVIMERMFKDMGSKSIGGDPNWKLDLSESHGNCGISCTPSDEYQQYLDIELMPRIQEYDQETQDEEKRSACTVRNCEVEQLWRTVGFLKHVNLLTDKNIVLGVVQQFDVGGPWDASIVPNMIPEQDWNVAWLYNDGAERIAKRERDIWCDLRTYNISEQAIDNAMTRGNSSFQVWSDIQSRFLYSDQPTGEAMSHWEGFTKSTEPSRQNFVTKWGLFQAVPEVDEQSNLRKRQLFDVCQRAIQNAKHVAGSMEAQPQPSQGFTGRRSSSATQAATTQSGGDRSTKSQGRPQDASRGTGSGQNANDSRSKKNKRGRRSDENSAAQQPANSDGNEVVFEASSDASASKIEEQQQRNSRKRTPCRDGRKCSKADCHFAHQTPAATDDIDFDAKVECEHDLNCNNRNCDKSHGSAAAARHNAAQCEINGRNDNASQDSDSSTSEYRDIVREGRGNRRTRFNEQNTASKQSSTESDQERTTKQRNGANTAGNTGFAPKLKQAGNQEALDEARQFRQGATRRSADSQDRGGRGGRGRGKKGGGNDRSRSARRKGGK